MVWHCGDTGIPHLPDAELKTEEEGKYTRRLAVGYRACQSK